MTVAIRYVLSFQKSVQIVLDLLSFLNSAYLMAVRCSNMPSHALLCVDVEILSAHECDDCQSPQTQQTVAGHRCESIQTVSTVIQRLCHSVSQVSVLSIVLGCTNTRTSRSVACEVWDAKMGRRTELSALARTLQVEQCQVLSPAQRRRG